MLPFLLIGLGAIVLLPLFFIPVRIFLRKRLVPLPSPKVPPSGAAPWSRTPGSAPLERPLPPTINYSAMSQSQGQQPFPVSPAIAPNSGYFGLTQNQQLLPTTPPLLPQVQAGPISASPPPGDPFAAVQQTLDTTDTGERKRLRRNGLRPTSAPIAIPEQIPRETPAALNIASDPYLRAMLQQLSAKGQAIQQTSEESL